MTQKQKEKNNSKITNLNKANKQTNNKEQKKNHKKYI